MSLRIIRAALEKRLKTWADLNNVKIAFEGVPFEKPLSDPYVQTYLLPANTITPNLDAIRRREVGIFQISVWTPDGTGTGKSDNLVEEIVQLYPVFPKWDDVSVEYIPSTSPPNYQTDGWRVIHISVYYRYES